MTSGISRFSVFIQMFRRIILFVVVGALANGCAGTKKVATAPNHARMSSAQMLEALKIRGEFIKTLSSLNKLSIQSPEGKKSFTQIILMDSVNKIRLESLNPFGQPSLFVVKNGQQALLYNVLENQYTRDERNSSPILSALGIHLSLQEVGYLLTQNFFRENQVHILGVEEGLEDGRIVLFLEVQGKKQEIHLNGDTLPVFFRQYDSFGTIEYEVEYSRYDSAGGFLYPHGIVIAFPVSNIKVILKVYDVTINEKIEQNNFVLRIPKGAKKYE